MKRKVTKADIDNNPELKERGVKIGDEIEIPEDENINEDPIGGDDTGGSTPPPNKGRG